MQTLLLAAELFVAAALIIVVMLQRSEGGALGMGQGGAGMGGLFTARGAADTLTRTTSILALLFFVTCIGLNLLALRGHDERSILDSARREFGPAKASCAGCAAGSQRPEAPISSQFSA